MIHISIDTTMVDREKLYAWLKDAYWAKSRSQDVIDRSLQNSLCLSAWDGEAMVGFARVVTDYSTFAWLCDVFVDQDHRSAGIGKALVQATMDHPDLQGIRWLLGTRDAHALYERYGFITVTEPDRFMTKNFSPRPPREPA